MYLSRLFPYFYIIKYFRNILEIFQKYPGKIEKKQRRNKGRKKGARYPIVYDLLQFITTYHNLSRSYLVASEIPSAFEARGAEDMNPSRISEHSTQDRL